MSKNLEGNPGYDKRHSVAGIQVYIAPVFQSFVIDLKAR